MKDALISWFTAAVFWVGAMNVGAYAWGALGIPRPPGWLAVILFFAPVTLFHLCVDPLVRYYGGPYIDDARREEREKLLTKRNCEQ